MPFQPDNLPPFEELVADAVAASVAGWDFCWLDGRTTADELSSPREWPTDTHAPTTLSSTEEHAGVPQLPGLFSVRGHR